MGTDSTAPQPRLRPRSPPRSARSSTTDLAASRPPLPPSAQRRESRQRLSDAHAARSASSLHLDPAEPVSASQLALSKPASRQSLSAEDDEGDGRSLSAANLAGKGTRGERRRSGSHSALARKKRGSLKKGKVEEGEGEQRPPLAPTTPATPPTGTAQLLPTTPPTALLPAVHTLDTGHHAAEAAQARSVGVVNVPFSAWGEALKDLDDRLFDTSERYFGSRNSTAGTKASGAGGTSTPGLGSREASREGRPKSRLEEALNMAGAAGAKDAIEVRDFESRPGTSDVTAVQTAEMAMERKGSNLSLDVTSDAMPGTGGIRIVESAPQAPPSTPAGLTVTAPSTPPSAPRPSSPAAAPLLSVSAPSTPPNPPRPSSAASSTLQIPDPSSESAVPPPPSEPDPPFIPIFILTDADEGTVEVEVMRPDSQPDLVVPPPETPMTRSGAAMRANRSRRENGGYPWMRRTSAAGTPTPGSGAASPRTSRPTSAVGKGSRGGSRRTSRAGSSGSLSPGKPGATGSPRMRPTQEELLEEEFRWRMRNRQLAEKEEKLEEELRAKRKGLAEAKEEVQFVADEIEVYRDHLIEVQKSIGDLLAQTIQTIHQVSTAGLNPSKPATTAPGPAQGSHHAQRLAAANAAAGVKPDRETATTPAGGGAKSIPPSPSASVSVLHLASGGAPTGPLPTDLDAHLRKASGECQRYAETVHAAVAAAAAAALQQQIQQQEAAAAPAAARKPSTMPGSRKKSVKPGAKPTTAAPTSQQGSVATPVAQPPPPSVMVWDMSPTQREAVVMATARIRFLSNQVGEAARTLAGLLGGAAAGMFRMGSTGSVSKRTPRESLMQLLGAASGGTNGSVMDGSGQGAKKDGDWGRSGVACATELMPAIDANGTASNQPTRRKSGVFQVYAALPGLTVESGPETPRSRNGGNKGGRGSVSFPAVQSSGIARRKSGFVTGGGGETVAPPPLPAGMFGAGKGGTLTAMSSQSLAPLDGSGVPRWRRSALNVSTTLPAL
ncbi:hypothetical protein HDU96_007536 [Phlyctochytrium bullatum]|nr:hypothetical protein HDU96_007536 [Phlyctochytrium bullatum]